MFCLIGKSGSGKDMLADILEGRGYHRIRAYTTRPRRDGEDENAYSWVSETMFIDQMAHEEFLETCSYETAYGKWYYGTPWPTVGKTNDKYFYILSPAGYEKAVKNLPDDISLKCIYVDSNNRTILKRLKKRNNNQDEKKQEEILRRFEADKKDFMKAYDFQKGFYESL